MQLRKRTLIEQLVHRRQLSPSQRIAISFAVLIAVGTILLHQPWCTPADQEALDWVSSLFTATSAVCVTGLIVVDTGSFFSWQGKLIILLLIQAGGLGILTFSNWLFWSIRQRNSFQTRLLLSESHGSLPNLRPFQLLKYIFVFTFVAEFLGAIVLTLRFWVDYPFQRAVVLGVFHAVSAYCNAGFSLFADSLMGYRGDTVINLSVMLLIVFGGLGFIVISDMGTLLRTHGIRRMRWRSLSYHSRVVLITTTALILTGAIVFSIVENSNTMKDLSPTERILASLFLSVTSRTAGFNTVDTGQLANASLLILILLMLIGASPGSTGGGIKTTTFAILAGLIKSRVRNLPRIECLGRSLPAATVSKAVSTAGIFVALLIGSVIMMELIDIYPMESTEGREVFLEKLFEATSALCTVGLSTGITNRLSTSNCLILTGLMYIGRVGPLLIAGSLIGNRPQRTYTLPEDNLMVG